MTTAADVANRALAQIAAQYTLTGAPGTLFDGSVVGQAAALLYQPAVLTILRAQDWEFSRASVALTSTGLTPPYPWGGEFLYPADCVRVRQVAPAALTDPNNPFAVTWDVGERLIAAVPTRVIWCNIPTPLLWYTTSAVTESDWDSLFAESVVRLLGSELAVALGGRIDLSRKMLGDSGDLAGTGRDRDS